IGELEVGFGHAHLAGAPAFQQPRHCIRRSPQPRPRQSPDDGGEEVERAGSELGHRASVATRDSLDPDWSAPAEAMLAAMLALIQRVTHARVSVDGEVVGAIGAGLLALVGVEPDDGRQQVDRMARRLLGYRVFADDAGRMNLGLSDAGGQLLLVSQFTLAADTRSG